MNHRTLQAQPASNSLQPTTSPKNTQPATARLDSWKEIAVYLNRSPRCVQRWEKNLELPVHRIEHAEGYTVYAYVPELEAWRQRREPPGTKGKPRGTPSPENRHDNSILLSSSSPRWRASVLALCRIFGKVVPLRLAGS
jgi:hypothetical protein